MFLITHPAHPIKWLTILSLLLCLQLLGCRQQSKQTASDSAANPVQKQAAIASTPQTSSLSVVDQPQTLADRWIISATEAEQLIAQGATVLDARGGPFTRRLPNTTVVNWRDFSPTQSNIRGTLLENDAILSQKLSALGISNNRPVVVFGNPPRGWGEEGRIVWMLRSLGHTQAVMVDGGFQAMRAANIAIPQTTTAPGNFSINRNPTWSIEQNDLKAQLSSDNLVIIDSREPREFSGSTPYGEQRGGHIPGAVHLYFKDLLDAEGKLLPQQTLLNTFESLGITADTQVVVYCTGGIRSGWLAAVIVSVGLPVQNYAGSMWEWSTASADKYPLETR